MDGRKTPSQRVGSRGEDIAVEYLENKGYEILQRNYRSRGGEIDYHLPGRNR